MIIMSEEAQEREERKPRRNDKYKCPKCGVKITVHVRISEPPTCHNIEAHTQSVVVMEKV